MADALNDLNASFGLGETARFTTGEGGLTRLAINAPAASGELYLHGAHVTSWRPAGQEEVIFVSRQSRWEAGEAIRGGIPVCFPWFRNKADDSKAPKHGFARTRSWRMASLAAEGDGVTVTLTLESDESSLAWWLHAFHATMRVHFGAQLKVALSVLNTGKAPFSFEEALHTYHRVGDATQTRVSGLDGVTYLDNVDGNLRKTQQGDVIFRGPTDNAYMETHSALTLHDPALERTLLIDKRGSGTTVVWNPWESGAQSIVDLGDEEWREMACVEASNILSGAVTLGAGQTHTMETTISIL
ncbi:MAG TPA: D-hexose-6-phosphate mutarotase [Acidobacteriaceae bacterium]|nr:D-hexose-6-phosphate mutarotase [Acidobacteriaceae bacterium]